MAGEADKKEKELSPEQYPRKIPSKGVTGYSLARAFEKGIWRDTWGRGGR